MSLTYSSTSPALNLTSPRYSPSMAFHSVSIVPLIIPFPMPSSPQLVSNLTHSHRYITRRSAAPAQTSPSSPKYSPVSPVPPISTLLLRRLLQHILQLWLPFLLRTAQHLHSGHLLALLKFTHVAGATYINASIAPTSPTYSPASAPVLPAYSPTSPQWSPSSPAQNGTTRHSTRSICPC
ncbi:hypothetical protein BKA82DRAFT_4366295 [Pisolithus tinctorius]|nr:hypothetical protein BKA82DRAFT_4366295 [Pisolithus tinctorius]